MDAYALLAMQLVKTEAESALPDAPIVPHRPRLFERITAGFIARDLRARGEVPLPKRADVRRAA